MGLYLHGALLFSASLFAATPAFAATIAVNASTEALLNGIYNYEVSNADIADRSINTTADGPRLAGQLYAGGSLPSFWFEDGIDWMEGGSAEAVFQYTADAETGEMSITTSKSEVAFGIASDVPPLARVEPKSNLEGRLTLSEAFTVTGSGILKIFYDLATDASMTRSYRSMLGFGASIGLQVEADSALIANRSAGSDSGACDSVGVDGACDAASDSRHLSFLETLDISGIDELILTQSIHTISYGQGNASVRSRLAYTTTGTLKLTPSDGKFLGDPALVPSPVPLPASLPLVMGGIGLLGWLGRRKA